MVDEQNCLSRGFEFTHVAEQFVYLVGDEHSGGFIENQDLSTSVEHLDDLDPLAFADLKTFDEVVGVDVESVGLTHLKQMGLRGFEVDLPK